MRYNISAYNHNFGKNREGNINTLKSFAETYRFNIVEIEKQFLEEQSINSTSIRKFLRDGNIEKANAMGVEFLREQMSFKDRNDFRVETVLGMLDRYGIIEGSLEKKDLKIVKELPSELLDKSRLDEKLRKDNLKLLAVVNYYRTTLCRNIYISDYFGFPETESCHNCDVCT